MLALTRLTSLVLLAMPLLRAYTADLSFASGEFGGNECLYTINRYRETKASAILEVLYNSISKKINDCIFPAELIFFKHNNSFPNPNVITEQSSLADIYNALFNAQYFVPADLYEDYVKALYLCNSDSIMECYKLLKKIFCKRSKREHYLLKLIAETCSKLKCRTGSAQREKVTHIGFFVFRSSCTDYFLISRSGRTSRVSKGSDSCRGVFFLPYECLFLHKWLRYSLEFDLAILTEAALLLNCDALVKVWKVMYAACVGIAGVEDDRHRGGYTKEHINLKLFSFFIIASVMPDRPSHGLTEKVHDMIRGAFCDENLDFTSFLSASLSISYK